MKTSNKFRLFKRADDGREMPDIPNVDWYLDSADL